MAAHALSFCSNWWSSSSSSLQQQQQQPPKQHLKPDTVSFQQRKRPRSSIPSSSPSPSLSFSNTYTNPNAFINTNNPFTPIQTNSNPFFSSHRNSFTTTTNTTNPNHLFPSDIYGTSTFFGPSSPQTLITPLDQDEYYHSSLDFLDGHDSQNTLTDPILDFSSPEDQILLAPLLADPPPTHIAGHCVQEEIAVSTDHQYHQPKKPCGGAGTPTVVSLQSIAARERRRKITERTSELGKLIPGGSKMSTAEMFQAAYKYVKFLQAQVSLLQLLASSNQEKDEKQVYVKELQVLVSPIIQEKLYSEEKCLVPKEFLDQTLAKNQLPLPNSV